MFDSVVKKCETCISLKDKPSRSKVSGLRAEIFGDLVFMDHGSIDVSQDPNNNVEIYFLIILDAASSMILANFAVTCRSCQNGW